MIFVTAFILLVGPRVPDEWTAPLRELDAECKLFSGIFATVVLSGLLFNLGIPHLRMYEGYPWRETWVGKWLKSRKIQRFRKLSERQRGLRSVLLAMEDLSRNNPEKKRTVQQEVDAVAPAWLIRDLYNDPYSGTRIPDADRWNYWDGRVLTHWVNLYRRISNEFPGSESLILPTRLGNSIRSFEHYVDREYGIDAVTLYPRLIAKIDKDYAAVIDDSKTSLDFMVNCSTLSLLLALSVLLSGPGTAVFQLDFRPLIVWALELLGLIVLAWLAYRGAIIRAVSWGDTVKSAFDLYRNALLPQLGYARTPESRTEERYIWDKVSRQILDGDSLTGPRIEYKGAPWSRTTLTSDTENAAIAILHGIEPQEASDSFLIIIRLTNTSAKDGVINAVLWDTLPDDLYYQSDSEKLVDVSAPRVSQPVTAQGINPYKFLVGNFSPNQTKILFYKAITLLHKEDKP